MQELTALQTRWNTLVGKIYERFASVVTEVEADVDQAFAANPSAPHQSLQKLQMLQTRYNNLTDKLDNAWEKLEEELDSLNDRYDENPAAMKTLNEGWLGLCKHHRQCIVDLEARWTKEEARIAARVAYEEDVVAGAADRELDASQSLVFDLDFGSVQSYGTVQNAVFSAFDGDLS